MADSDLRGLDDGFGEYLSTTERDNESALQSGLVSVDTNVLLNLYRYDSGPASELLRVLGLLEHRLFVSNQVVREFWENRGEVIRQTAREREEFRGKLELSANSARETLSAWRNRTGSTDEEWNELLDPITAALDAASIAIVERGGQATRAPNTEEDSVLANLRELLAGKVGHRPADEEAQADLAEGLRRVVEGIAPGFRDSNKEGDSQAGDYLVWIQSLREARARGVSHVVFVTDDANKGDWFEIRSGETVGPHRQLVRDALQVVDGRLILIRTPQLLKLANEYLDAQVREESIESIDAVASRGARWSVREIERFMELLAVHSYVHHQTIMEACASNGRISRERVYQLAGYDADRTLRGFTRPTKTVVRQMLEDGTLSDPTVAEPLVARYDSPESYVLASHFEVPPEFLRWYLSDSESGS